jgi:hypothetical protein
MYTPVHANFALYKPGQTRIGSVYGEHYYSTLLDNALLKDSVLDLQNIEYVIDDYGLRNVDDPASARVFVLGDSFCFGYRVTQKAVFSEIMKSRLGEPVYNMGVSGSSPKQQLLMFDYLARTYPDTFRPKRLLWLIFEGNDLEESYDDEEPKNNRFAPSEIFRGTLVGNVAQIPGVIRNQSVIRSLTGGEIVLTAAIARAGSRNHYELDGETLAYPLYWSDRFGYRLFRQQYISRAGEPESYVLGHPNARRLADTFQAMKVSARDRGFEVTVVVIPSDARLYKDYFEDLPPFSEEPHFIRYVERLSDDVGFGHIDLNELLAPYAREELLFYRDDTHWNNRGHEIVAELLTHHVPDLVTRP